MYAKIMLNIKTCVNVFNTHAQSDYSLKDKKTDMIKWQQFREIRQFIQSKVTSSSSSLYCPDPVLLGGDFNLNSHIYDENDNIGR